MKAGTMRKVRLVHQYIALFFAPMILLFALSGALQTFRLQEAHGANAPAAPAWIVWLASVHKDQSLPRAEIRHVPPPVPDEVAGRRRGPPDEAHASSLPLKIFVTLLSAGLIVSTMLGIMFALNNRATRQLSGTILAGGIFLPLLLLYL